MTLRRRPGFDEALDAIAAELGTGDRSKTIHFLVFEKARALGLREKAAAAAAADPDPSPEVPPARRERR